MKLLGLIYVTVREFSEGEPPLRAMSLVYTSLLSLVPLLAFSFSILKAFGMHNQLEPLLYNFLPPLGSQENDIYIIIPNTKVRLGTAVLGGVVAGVMWQTMGLIMRPGMTSIGNAFGDETIKSLILESKK